MTNTTPTKTPICPGFRLMKHTKRCFGQAWVTYRAVRDGNPQDVYCEDADRETVVKWLTDQKQKQERGV